jgi:hypothetical protein
VFRRRFERQGIDNLHREREKAFVADDQDRKPSRREGLPPRAGAKAARGMARSGRGCRHYLIFDKKAGVPHHDLTKAIDDYVEKLTDDHRTLHAPNHSIG